MNKQSFPTCHIALQPRSVCQTHDGPSLNRYPFTRHAFPTALLLWLLCTASLPAALRVSPAAFVLQSPETTQQLLVTGQQGAGPVDFTRTAAYKVLDESVAAVDATGLVAPKAEGKTEILISHGGEQARVAVTVTGLRSRARSPLSRRSSRS